MHFHFSILTEKDVKVLNNWILTSKRSVKHPFAGRNTQLLLNSYVELLCRFASNPLGVNELMLGLLVVPSTSGMFKIELDFGGVGLISDAIEKSDDETSRCFSVSPDV